MTFAAIMHGRDEPPKPIEATGVSLLDCLLHLPGLPSFCAAHNVRPLMMRGAVKCAFAADNVTSTMSFVFHPGSTITWQEIQSRIKVPDVAGVTKLDQGNGGIIRITASPTNKIEFSMPDTSMLDKNEVLFWSDDVRLNEFGYLYIALHITGNYCRYYPDRWHVDVERSTPLALAVEQITEEASVRAPLLTLSELSQKYLVQGRLT